jgi:hypothetical protein
MERAEREMVSMAKCLLGKLLDKWAGCLFPDKQNGGHRLVCTWPAVVLSIRPKPNEIARRAHSRRGGIPRSGRASLLNAKEARSMGARESPVLKSARSLPQNIQAGL